MTLGRPKLEPYKFLGERPKDSRDRVLAICVAMQQSAGFNQVIDTREMKCPLCKAPGFNTGWGYWRFACGAEQMTDGDMSTSCKRGKF